MIIRGYDCNIYKKECGIKSVVTARSLSTKIFNSIEVYTKDEEAGLVMCIKEIQYNYLCTGGMQ